MALFSKFIFKWREPGEFAKERDSRDRKTSKWWHQVLGVGVCMFFLLLIWFLATLDPNKTPPSFEFAFLLAILFGIVVVYVVPWMVCLSPTWIGITAEDLRIVRGNTARSVKWRDVEFFHFSERHGFPILRLELRRGGKLEIGVDSSVLPDDIGLFLRDVGVFPGSEQTGTLNPIPPQVA
jgi:hypothetical protein